MSQYNKTVLTNAGLELAKRANAGQAKFEITRAVTSADDWSNKTIQDLEEATAIPNIMQQGTIMDAEEVESNNSVIGVSLCFTNKNLSTGYQIRIIGLYVKEEGQENDFLYAVTTAATPEYMPDFNDKVMYRFNMQMYLVIGKAQAVNVVINDGASVTHGQFDKYKGEVSEDLKRIEENHKEDMSHVVKSASVNGGAEILPDGSGKLNLIVPDPDLSKYVSLEQLGELLKAKADITAVPDKTDTEKGIKQAKAAAKAADDKAQSALVQLPNKADTSTVNAQIADAKNTIKSNVDSLQIAINSINSTRTPLVYGSDGDDLFTFKASQIRLYNGNGKTCKNLPPAANTQYFTVQYVFESPTNDGIAIYRSPANEIWTAGCNGKAYNVGWVRLANSNDISNLQNQVDSKTSGTVVTAYDIASRTPTKETNSYTNYWLVDQGVLTSFADQINQLKGRRQVDTPDFNTLTDSGVYLISNTNSGKNTPPTDNWGTLAVFDGGSNQRIMQIFSADDGTSVFTRIYGINGEAVWGTWNQIAWKRDITDLQNQIQQLKDNQFEVQTFTDATAAANWEAQRPGKRMAIVNQ
ncbi:pyocin knob domain-containing protein [Lactobacillus helveticus]|uniref:pyocin knob domain-containing protein n=1 Tax=Lactobacillus helveticus TaxID=1587 RepID=UPI0021A5C850|nr:pyocin knob domain-containing protein [Lactobacillus helveticus]MCT3400970.1 hypothetical protein [Lactobacillus helveticus]